MSEELAGFVHEFIPAEPGAPPFTLLLLHGTGGDEQGMIPLGKEVGSGVAMLSPLGRDVENGQRRFCRCPAEGPAELAGLQTRVDELAGFLQAAGRRYDFDPAAVVAMGYSNGAVMAASMLLLRPRAFKGALMFRPLVPLAPQVLPRLQKLPVFIAGGRQDVITPPEAASELAELLEASGADVTLRWQDAEHRINLAELRAAAEWSRARWAISTQQHQR
jgi:predicted esterase